MIDTFAQKVRRNQQKGQSLVEFALVLIILIIFILVIFDLSRAIFYYSVLHNAAREGARYAIINPDAPDNEIIEVSRRITNGMVFASSDVNKPSDDTIRVELEYTFTPATPVLSLITGDPSFDDFTLRAQATMNIEK